ncbi:hypothetical protein EVAR_10703_1 [Eumeta japonica]|uniref:Uncharacterized protein n=1 Tax=Eumeta variegata TaxID=151549 RepID=A0A4C1U717_EUMVA|nr:hypothetical protein EVAR_10703_1 [Eumeta japonica]
MFWRSWLVSPLQGSDIHTAATTGITGPRPVLDKYWADPSVRYKNKPSKGNVHNSPLQTAPRFTAHLAPAPGAGGRAPRSILRKVTIKKKE